LGLKLKVGISDHVKVTGYGLDGEVTGKVAVDSPYDSPTKLTGTLSLSGEYAAYGKELIIKRGNLQYNNNLVYEPRLDILTERVIEEENVTVGLQITGPAAKPKTTVVSNPAMSDSDALSWLLFGRPLNSVSAGQADSINAKSMALNAGGSFLVGTLGRKVGLDQASISESRALGDSTLTIGKQISPRLFVSYGVSLLFTPPVRQLRRVAAGHRPGHHPQVSAQGRPRHFHRIRTVRTARAEFGGIELAEMISK
ncbi:MAG: hypothetical protein RLZZ537_1087, partial [Pseudomonadota bacterium]